MPAGPCRAGGSDRGDLGPALRAGASDTKPLSMDSLVPGVRRAASLFCSDFKTVFIKNKQNSNSGQALEGAAVFYTLTEEKSPQCSLTLSRPWSSGLVGRGSSAAGSDGAEGGFGAHGSQQRS